MKIRNQIVVNTALFYFLIIIISVTILRPAVLNNFKKIEYENSLMLLRNLKNSILKNEQNLVSGTKDWAFWDDTYNFIKTENRKYIESNIVDSTFTDLKINLILLFDTQGKPVFGEFYDINKDKSLPLPEGLVKKISTIKKGCGIITYDDKIFMLAVEPIRTSNRKGPSRGAFVMGKILTEEFLSSLNTSDWMKPSWALISEIKKNKPIFIISKDKNTLTGFILLNDPEGKPSVLIESSIERIIFQGGLKTVKSILLITFVAFIILLGFFISTFEYFITPRVNSIIGSIKKTKQAGNFAERIPLSRYDHKLNDELTEIKKYINELFSVIETLTGKLKKTNESLEIKVAERTRELISEVEQKKEAEEKLKESEERFRKMAESVQDGILIIENRLTIFVNNKVKEILGFSPSNTNMSEFWHLLDPKELQSMRTVFEKMQLRSASPEAVSFWINRKDGTKRYIHATYYPDIKKGKPLRRYITLTDITDQKISEERYKSVVDNAHEVIIVIQGGKIKFIHRKALDITGYSEEEMYSTDYTNFIHPEDLNTVKELYIAYKKSGGIPETVLRILKKDGNFLWVKANAVKITWDGKSAALVFLNDITPQKNTEIEREKLREQLKQMQKLAAVQNLAGGIAHDLNNILTPIMGYADLAKLELGNSPAVIKHLSEIKANAKRAAELIKKLLAFSRKQLLKRESLQLNSVIENLKTMLSRLIEENITIDYNLEQNLPSIKADKNEIEQLLVNLIVNARDAMDRGGTITVATNTFTADEDYCRNHLDARQGDYVCILVSDTGKGMDRETVKNIFEPFFTTKEFGYGSGLGLAVVYGIVKQHGGFIEVASAVGEGSIFRLCFPIDSSVHTVQENINLEELAINIDGTGKRVLIVEDEPSIRSFTYALLENYQFSVTETRSTEDAELRFNEDYNNFDLVISDIVLPGSSGIDFAEKIHAVNPGIPFILVSGYSKNPEKYPVFKNPKTTFLKKPYTIFELLKTIKDILNKFK